MPHQQNEGEEHVIVSIGVEKAFDPLIVKTFNRIGIEGDYFNIITGMYEKPTTDLTPNGERLKVFPLRSGTRKGCLL